MTARSGGLLRAGPAVALAGVLANGLAYLAPMLGGRALPAAGLSALATVLALGAVGSVPGLGLQIAVAVHRARGGTDPAGRLAWIAAGICAAAVLAAGPVLVGALDLSLAMVGLLAAATGTAVLGCRWLGELQGDQRFLRLAAAMTVLAVTRYGGVIAGLLVGLDATGALLAGVLVGVATLPVLAWLARPAGRRAAATADAGAAADAVGGPGADAVAGPGADAVAGPGADAVAGPGADAVAGPATGRLTAAAVLTASSATLAMLVLSYADLIMARYLLSPVDSGGYAIGAVLTKGAIWAPQVVTIVALPRLARGDRRARGVALALVAGCGALLVLASALAGGLAFRLAGGPDYVPLGRYAPYFAAVGALYALVYVMVNAQVAAGARRPAAPLWITTVGLLGWLLATRPESIQAVVAAALVAAAFATAATAVAMRRTPASAPVAGVAPTATG
ncbi:polysaccharide biosynthesis protein [Solwaraspora sp. WMMD791]|uniref:polysaccharide biosynthesis protein n=1 Tax=Solwaraspora sp. WMMD791 TaxID=3016086 RepID=UPI00249BE257|nr:polysaccharide biosynthesis protein [Solwaraspora sp. WMMD791]WFE26157.1 polysaccharide biosynthesis protein [Solwaraspora sp. WMMD791]